MSSLPSSILVLSGLTCSQPNDRELQMVTTGRLQPPMVYGAGDTEVASRANLGQ